MATEFFNGQFVRIREDAKIDGQPHPCAGLEAVIRIGIDETTVQIRLVVPPKSGRVLWDMPVDQLELIAT